VLSWQQGAGARWHPWQAFAERRHGQPWDHRWWALYAARARAAVGEPEWEDPRCNTACPQWKAGECDTFCDPRLHPPTANTCEHGWPGATGGQAHPYIPAPSIVPGRDPDGLPAPPEAGRSAPAVAAAGAAHPAGDPPDLPDGGEGDCRNDPFSAPVRQPTRLATPAERRDARLDYAPAPPFTDCLSDDTIARGMTAVKP
jgi:hypothetical protein